MDVMRLEAELEAPLNDDDVGGDDALFDRAAAGMMM
jgi:hypothetical protein